MNTKIDFDRIETKYKKLIDIAKEKMKTINDFEHNIHHVEDVVFYAKKLMAVLNKRFDAEVVLLSAYWHDVGRTVAPDGHEKRSAEMLKQELVLQNFNTKFIEKCYLAISDHKYNMAPKTIEGKIVKDADKLAWLGLGRWQECINGKQNLDSIINLLPNLRNDILQFKESRKIYDAEIVKLTALLYNNLNKY